MLPPGLPLRDIERLAITRTLHACGGNRAETARRLGLSKKGFYLKMKRLGIWSYARERSSGI
jgi:DNA-binding NtrC family response regulator